MSWLGEEILLALNQLVPPLNEAQLAAKRDLADYVRFFRERSASSFSLFGDVDLQGKVVLDLGCGLGANLVYLASLGLCTLTAVDIDAEQVGHAQVIFDEQVSSQAGPVRFVTADAARMPFADGCFDAIIAADTLEHIADLESALYECARILAPGGSLYAYFPPYYAPWGAHMVNWIRLPWCQVFFSEATVVRAARRLERRGGCLNASLPPGTRLNLGTGEVIPFVNHLTVGRFEELVKRMSVWKSIDIRLLPPAWRSRHPLSVLARPLTRLPVFGEMFTARVVAVLEKAPGSRAQGVGIGGQARDVESRTSLCAERSVSLS